MNIKIYDNGGKTFDRYTCIYMDDKEPDGSYGAVGMSEYPFSPQGFGQHSSAMIGKHLGKRIKFDELPTDCQLLIKQDLGA